MSRLSSTNDEFNKVKEALMNDIKIIQTQNSNSQKKLKIAEEIVEKTKVEYKKLNDEYVKLQAYKDKCEKYIKHLQKENTKLQLELNHLYEREQSRRNRNYYRLTPAQQRRQQEQEEEDNFEQDDDVDDITEHEPKPPPNKIRKKIKKGISNFI